MILELKSNSLSRMVLTTKLDSGMGVVKFIFRLDLALYNRYKY